MNCLDEGPLGKFTIHGLTPQTYPYLTGPEYLPLAGSLRGLPPGTLDAHIDGFMTLFGLTDDRHPALGLLEGRASRDTPARDRPLLSDRGGK